MIAIDTNVLLRYLLQDDEAQAEKAGQLINGPTKVLITDVVLVETLWTLKGKKYRLDKAGVLKLLNSLFKEPNLYFEDGPTVWMALNDYRQAQAIKVGSKRKEADFSDALIVNKARYHAAATNGTQTRTYTFDLAAQVLPGAMRPSASKSIAARSRVW